MMDTGCLETLSQTSLVLGNCKRSTPDLLLCLLGLAKGHCGRRWAGEAEATAFLDAAGPCPDGGVSAAVRVKDGQRVRGAGVAFDGDEHAAAGREGVEDASVM